MIKKISLRFITILITLPSLTHAQNLTLQLHGNSQTQFIGYYIAKEKGFYQSFDFNVSIKQGDLGITPWQELKSGRADFAVDNTNAFAAYINDEPITGLAAMFQHSPSIFLAKSSSNIYKPIDFIDKKVMIHPGLKDLELALLLSKQGISTANTRLVDASADISDLLSNTVDVYNAQISNEPYLLQKSRTKFNIISPKQYGIDFYSDILITHKNFALNNPDTVDRFLAASLEGWRYALNHPEESINILLNKYATNKDIGHLRYELNTIRELIMPDLFAIGHMNPKRWENIRDILFEYKLTNSQPSVDDFIYKPKESITWKHWLPVIYPMVGLIMILTILSFYLISLNQKLKREIVNRINTEGQLKHLANHDPLTGLANRAALTSKLDMSVKLARRNDLTPALLYIDLDGFKHINDTQGHSSGDQVLIRFANRVKTILRESDTFARIGGDEFVILLASSDRTGAHCLARKILLNLQTPFKLISGDHYINASIGIAIYDRHDEKADQFLTRADNAMYHIKKNGKAGISIAPSFSNKARCM